MNTLPKLKTAEVSSVLDMLGVGANKVSSAIAFKFQISRNVLYGHRGQEMINYTNVKYGKMFSARHIAQTPAVVKIDTFKKE